MEMSIVRGIWLVERVVRFRLRFHHSVRACLGYRSFDTAERTLQGVEAINMIGKRQVKRIDRSDAVGQAKFVESLFLVAA
jgi:hypothetical protein